MSAYLVRRVLYALPILLGVNLLIFLLFFYVQSPDDMAETFLGEKRVTQEMKENWKREHGYHLPRLLNPDEPFPAAVTQTIFWQKMTPLFLFRFGVSDMDGSRIGAALRARIPYSLCLTVPILLASLAVYLSLALLVAFCRGTAFDAWTLVACVLMMSISAMFYILGGQYLLAIKLKLVPVSGFDRNLLYAVKFLLLPIAIGIASSIGSGVRYYRTVFLEEIGKDYVRTARAKGLGEGTVLFKHVLRNAMFPILTNVVVGIPFLIMGMLLTENFFGIPGLGNYMIDAIHKQDFAVVRAMVFLGSFLYIVGLVLVDLSYTLFDPRVTLQ
jgi:peptide/nickel transport system permease protein